MLIVYFDWKPAFHIRFLTWSPPWSTVKLSWTDRATFREHVHAELDKGCDQHEDCEKDALIPAMNGVALSHADGDTETAWDSGLVFEPLSTETASLDRHIISVIVGVGESCSRADEESECLPTKLFPQYEHLTRIDY